MIFQKHITLLLCLLTNTFILAKTIVIVNHSPDTLLLSNTVCVSGQPNLKTPSTFPANQTQQGTLTGNDRCMLVFNQQAYGLGIQLDNRTGNLKITCSGQSIYKCQQIENNSVTITR